MSDKATIRKEIANIRESMDNGAMVVQSEKICDAIINSDEYKQASAVLVYSAIGCEVNLDKLIEHSLAVGKRVLFPVCYGKRSMDAYEVKSIEQLKVGRYNILEPDTEICPKAEPNEIDYVAVPGVAFDTQLNRLGRGAGYYDSFLPLTKACKVGVAYDFQIVDSLPVDEFDYKMDMIISDSRILRGDR